MAELTSEGMRPQFERDHIRLAKILSDTVTQWRKDVPPPNENAFRMQNWQLVRTSRIFLQSEEAFCRTSAPRFFEVALGLEGTSGESPLDDAAPAVIHLPGGHSIRARGQIDRVDALDERRFTIWDYKIGSGYGYDRADPFRQGRRVQSVLYLRMIESAIRKGLHPKAIVESFGYFFPSIRAQGLRIDWSAGDLASGMNVLERLCASIEEGAFVATDDKDDCTYCDYAAICGNVIKVTRQSKELLARGDVVQLRHLQELRRG